MSKEYSFKQKVSWLISGLFAAQLVHLLFSLILPRIYNPTEFAVFGIFLSSIFILFEINNLRLDQALMLPKSEAESLFLFRRAMIYSTGISVLLALIWFAYAFSSFYNAFYEDLKFIPLSIFLQGIIQPSVSYSNRVQNYKWINTARVLQAVITGLVSCTPLFFQTNKIFLIQGFVAGQLASCMIYIMLYISKLWQFNSSAKFSIKPYIQFPKYGAFSSFLNTVSRNAIVYILSIFFTPTAVGLYTFTNRLVQAPIGLVTGAFGQAYFRDATHAESREKLVRLTESVQKILAQLAVIPVVIALFFGPALFEFLFGSEWREAGMVARYLALWYGTTLVITPLSMLIDVKGMLKWELGYNAVFAFLRIGTLILSGLFLSFGQTMILFCTVSVVFNLYLLIFVKRLVHHEN